MKQYRGKWKNTEENETIQREMEEYRGKSNNTAGNGIMQREMKQYRGKMEQYKWENGTIQREN